MVLTQADVAEEVWMNVQEVVQADYYYYYYYELLDWVEYQRYYVLIELHEATV